LSTDKRSFYKQKIVEARAELENLLASLTDEQQHIPIISEGQIWNALDIAAHLLENERAMSIHVHKIRQGKETVPEGFDLDKWNAGLKDRAEVQSMPQILEELKQSRVKTLEVLESIKDDEWELQGRHPLRGMISIEQYYETIAGHDTWHVKDIKKALKP
jgi:hypothetical protein